MPFEPDYRNIVDAAYNRRPKRLPVYEHIIAVEVMEKVLDTSFVDLFNGDDADVKEAFGHYCRFFKEMTYDTVSFEMCIAPILPGSGALMGGKPGPIQNRKDFDAYPWDELARIYWSNADRHFSILGEVLPAGMKAIGGVGNGVFEISEDLVGYEYLSYMMIDDPELFSDLYKKIGELMVDIWSTFLSRYSKDFAVCRFGDDLGYKTGTLLSPETIQQHILPQYQRVISMVREAKLPFLWHSCGNIFSVMDSVIALGINAKHSNEDTIAGFETWIDRYADKIGLFGGIDVNVLCLESPDDIFKKVLSDGERFRRAANGFALGSGNSIPDYVPIDGYLAMIGAAKELRKSQ